MIATTGTVVVDGLTGGRAIVVDVVDVLVVVEVLDVDDVVVVYSGHGRLKYGGGDP